MTHPRTDIRNAVVAALTDTILVSGVAVEVESTRILPNGADDLPKICVYSNPEDIEEFNASPRVLKRTLSLSIEIILKGKANIENDLDALALQVEHEMMQDYTLGGTCSNLTQTGSNITANGDGEEFIGSCVLSYDIMYKTYEVADSTVANGINTLGTVDVKYILPDEDVTGKDSAEDKITIPTT